MITNAGTIKDGWQNHFFFLFLHAFHIFLITFLPLFVSPIISLPFLLLLFTLKQFRPSTLTFFYFLGTSIAFPPISHIPFLPHLFIHHSNHSPPHILAMSQDRLHFSCILEQHVELL